MPLRISRTILQVSRCDFFCLCLMTDNFKKKTKPTNSHSQLPPLVWVCLVCFCSSNNNTSHAKYPLLRYLGYFVTNKLALFKDLSCSLESFNALGQNPTWLWDVFAVEARGGELTNTSSGISPGASRAHTCKTYPPLLSSGLRWLANWVSFVQNKYNLR